MKYVWECKNCGGRQEVERPFDEWEKEPEEACCASPDRYRTISVTSFILKGTGWYARGGY